MYVIVAGCGRVGSQLAEYLSHESHDVVIIDKNAESFKRLGTNFNGMTLEGIAFDEELLHEAGIERADAFAAVTNYDSTNLMSAEIANNIYNVPRVISRLYNPDKELTFFKMGIDYICGTTLMSDRIREKLFQDENMIVQQERIDLGLEVVELSIPPCAEGKAATDLNQGVNSKLVSLVRDNKQVDSTESTGLKAGDRAIVTVRKEGWKAIASCLGDETLAPLPGYLVPAHRASFFRKEPESSGISVVIGGCSQVGSYLAYILSMEGYNVTIIEDNPEKFKRLPRNYKGATLTGTVYDEETLFQAGIEEADAFIAVTKLDNTNLMAAEVVRHVFHVPHVIARLFNPDKEQTYQALGLNYVCGTRLLAKTFLERMLNPPVRTGTSCLNNMFDLVEFDCPESWEGKSIHSVCTKFDISLTYVARRSSGYLPEEKFVLRRGDSLTALASGKQQHKLEKYLVKQKR